MLAPNLTIYNKLIADFTPTRPSTSSRVAEFATEPRRSSPATTTSRWPVRCFDVSTPLQHQHLQYLQDQLRGTGGKAPRIKRLCEYIGESYFEYLSDFHDLVLLMDESHRYRASAGIKAINEFKPILGLELTATPFTETLGGAAFKNVIFDYPLSKALEDGFVKEPAVITRKNFNPADAAGGDELKLEDGVRLHENTKVQLEIYARENEGLVKPFMLVVAQDITHANELST